MTDPAGWRVLVLSAGRRVALGIGAGFSLDRLVKNTFFGSLSDFEPKVTLPREAGRPSRGTP